MARKSEMIVPVLLFVATLCFALGLVLPVAVFERLFVFTERPSLLDVIAGLWDEGDMLIAFVVGLFSVAFPAAKLLVLHLAAYAPERLHWWSAWASCRNGRWPTCWSWRW